MSINSIRGLKLEDPAPAMADQQDGKINPMPQSANSSEAARGSTSALNHAWPALRRSSGLRRA
jgi:hypothetical protein